MPVYRKTVKRTMNRNTRSMTASTRTFRICTTGGQMASVKRYIKLEIRTKDLSLISNGVIRECEQATCNNKVIAFSTDKSVSITKVSSSRLVLPKSFIVSFVLLLKNSCQVG